jgi:hypothetical protein
LQRLNSAAVLSVQLQGVNEVAAIMMRGDYVSVNTVLDDERPSHESIAQVGCINISRVTFPSIFACSGSCAPPVAPTVDAAVVSSHAGISRCRCAVD